MTDLTSYIAGLPKVELHVHHVGSASPRAVAELAARHAGSTPVPADEQSLAEYFTFTDFAHFVEVYRTVVDLIRTPEDVHTLTVQIARDLAAQNVRYAELTVTPHMSVVRGIDATAFCETIEDVRVGEARRLGLEMQWCFDIAGEEGLAGADGTLEIALTQRPDGLVSFGLGGPEIGVPRPPFAPHFARARAAGLRSVPHAGESTGPQTIWDALQHLGAERIGHGITAVQDPALLAHLAEHQIPLEISPTSNVCTRSVTSYAAHPLPALVAAGVPVSINSDDPPMFATSLNREYAVAADLLGLDESGVTALARAALAQSFAPDDVRARVAAEIDAYAAASG